MRFIIDQVRLTINSLTLLPVIGNLLAPAIDKKWGATMHP
jgi:hypothetical protein